MHDLDGLGVFYLGRTWDSARGEATGAPILYDAKDLTTHAVCVGMTGSGKTGLGVTLLEEAALDGVPAIVIDPKGDLTNLALAFPELRPEDFRPWIHEDEARRQGSTPDELAARTAARFREGLAATGQTPERIARFRDAAEVAVYTPGARAGRPLSVLRSLDAPPPAVRAQPDLLRERIQGAVSGLLALVGVEADPLRSREHVLLASLVERAWAEGRALDLPSLIRQVQAPPITQVGVFDLETFFPARERTGLAMALNNLLASPGFAAWSEGEPLDVGRLLYGPSGKPRLAILSIGHLADAERMFFVTLLLSEVIAWMRGQPGTSSLRALLYMDEIFGYFPPTAAPPSKAPMLTLLKQARAFGLGVVLASQNPVDLDYKGLANAGTWFVGRLQTERDKLRLLDGLEGALAASGRGLARAELDRMLSGLGNRVFLMNNVHDDGPVLFQTRWALSYLRGPLSRDELARLAPSAAPEVPAASAPEVQPVGEAHAERPVVPPDVSELFLAGAEGEPVVYQPRLFASARVRFASAKVGVDEWQTVACLVPLPAAHEPPAWDRAEVLPPDAVAFDPGPRERARFAPVPAGALQKASYERWRRAFADHLYQHHTLTVWRCADPKLASAPGESEAAFRARLAQAARERRDAEVEALRRKYAPKVSALQDKVRRAEDKVARERSEAREAELDFAVAVGSSILGALVGRRGGVGVRGAMRSASRSGRNASDVARAHDELAAARERLASLEADLEADFRAIHRDTDPAALPLERVVIRARKSDVLVGTIALAWTG